MTRWLALGILLVAVWNAAGAALEWKSMRWSVALYWCWVAAYWMLRAAEG